MSRWTRLSRQFKDATNLEGGFPIRSWVLAGPCQHLRIVALHTVAACTRRNATRQRRGCAGGCVCGLALNEYINVRPMRRKLDQQEKEAAGIAGTASAEARVLPSGQLLMPDGRIMTKREQK